MNQFTKFESLWYKTKLPEEIIQIFEKSLLEENISKEENLKEAEVDPNPLDSSGNLIKSIRDSKVTFFDTSNWICGFISHYVMRANNQNFGYHITGIDRDALQYTSYEKGEYYGWHIDAISTYENTPIQRKLSFSLQLSEETEYEGGDLQLLDSYSNKMYSAPREKGTIIIFDSRVRHRVTRVRSGRRKSIVGWYCGPSMT